MEIKIFMDITDRKYNMSELVVDYIILDDVNSGLDNLQTTDRFNKLNAKKF